jgi:hypothetical protein
LLFLERLAAKPAVAGVCLKRKELTLNYYTDGQCSFWASNAGIKWTATDIDNKPRIGQNIT